MEFAGAGNEFLLHLKSANIETQHNIILELLNSEQFGASLINYKLFEAESKAAYRIRMLPSVLILFKRRFDQLIRYELLELFEYKEW
ncbi:hypothetical protein I5907_17260 [Panacibacter sp. DH6]|uniref:Uncharacterized protein n=1 Tax=Panacibacter microcysteis TaxID=2793269 RepID=A0A931MCA4_9BACT|nr:hypothetical protein [Panacibacter microcysteis]MBG9377991.1 hypothetical protein [Panacibacter microcysteis]